MTQSKDTSIFKELQMVVFENKTFPKNLLAASLQSIILGIEIFCFPVRNFSAVLYWHLIILE
jgi:hypothetical protein